MNNINVKVFDFPNFIYIIFYKDSDDLVYNIHTSVINSIPNFFDNEIVFLGLSSTLKNQLMLYKSKSNLYNETLFNKFKDETKPMSIKVIENNYKLINLSGKRICNLLLECLKLIRCDDLTKEFFDDLINAYLLSI